MDSRSDEMALGALLRMLGMRLPGTESAVFAVAEGRMRLLARSPGFEPAGKDANAGWRPLDAALAGLAGAQRSVPFDAAAFGQSARFCAVHPLGGASGLPDGFLVLCDSRRRRLGAEMATALADAALVVGGLLAARARPQTLAAVMSPEAKGEAVLPRAAAHRMIEAARRRRVPDLAPVSPDTQAVAVWAVMNSRGERIFSPECGW